MSHRTNRAKAIQMSALTAKPSPKRATIRSRTKIAATMLLLLSLRSDLFLPTVAVTQTPRVGFSPGHVGGPARSSLWTFRASRSLPSAMMVRVGEELSIDDVVAVANGATV